MVANLGRPPFRGGERRAAGARSRASAAVLPDVEVERAGRPGADRASGSERPKRRCRRWARTSPTCGSWTSGRRRWRARPASSRAPATPARTGSRSRVRAETAEALAEALLEQTGVAPRGTRRARQPAAGGGALPLRLTTSTRRPARSRRAWLGDPEDPPQRRGARGRLPRRRAHPARAGGGRPPRRRVGLRPEGRAPMRARTELSPMPRTQQSARSPPAASGPPGRADRHGLCCDRARRGRDRNSGGEVRASACPPPWSRCPSCRTVTIAERRPR